MILFRGFNCKWNATLTYKSTSEDIESSIGAHAKLVTKREKTLTYCRVL